MKFVACFMIVVTVVAAFVGVKIVDLVETADQFRPNVEQVIQESRK